MKPRHLLVAAAAVLAIAGCNGEKDADNAGTTTAAVKPVPPPASGDWSEVVTQTPEGGFMMGNPNADVKLVEFASMTCHYCAEFDETGTRPLIDKYVKTGRVAFEFRNFVRDPFDITATLLARCNGARSFFPLTKQLFADQKNWINRLSSLSPQQQQSIQSLLPAQQFRQIAQLAGFQQWAAMRGVPTAKSGQCLTNQDEVNRLVQINSDAISGYNISGTPTFVINGKVVEDKTWTALEPKIREAIGS